MLPPPALLILGLALACTPTAALPDDTAASRPDGTEPPPAPEVALHPVQGSLLQVSWTQQDAATTWVEVWLDGAWRPGPASWREAGAQAQTVPGVPYDTETRVRLVQQTDDEPVHGPAVDIRTAALPETMPLPSLVTGRPELQDADSPYMLLSTNEPGAWTEPWWTMIVDREGRVVWARSTTPQTSTLFGRVSPGGDSLVFDESTFWTIFDLGVESTVVEVRLDGTVVDVVPTPGLHHDFERLPDGRTVWGAYGESKELLLERTADGEERVVWTCEPDEVGGICSSNSVYWREATDTVLFSLVTLDSVVEIDLATGEALHWYGGRVSGAYPVQDPDTRFWKQHGARYTDEGTLLMSTWDEEDGQLIVAAEYEIDHEARTLVQTWSHAQPESYFGYVLGDVERLPGGNTLHTTGRGRHAVEITPDGTVAWDLMLPDGCDMGQASPVADLWALLPP